MPGDEQLEKDNEDMREALERGAEALEESEDEE